VIDWLCEEIGLPLVEELEGGALQLNQAAQALVAPAARRDLIGAVLALMANQDGPMVARCVDAARRGKRTELPLQDDMRALFAPVWGATANGSPGRACVVFVPAQLRDPASLQRRARATDRSARVSHELANALGAIAGWARLAQEGARVDEALELIGKSAEHAWSTARTILGEVSGQEAQSPDAESRTVDLSAFVEEAARLLLPKALKKNVTLQTSVTPGLCVPGDRGTAWTIVWNLATNAVEAMPASGGIVGLQLTATGNAVHRCVSDNGPGMSAEVRLRVFEPYFTTKRTGSGIGLSMVKQAVTELGGTVDLQSAPGAGTRFQIDLPRAITAEQPRRRSLHAKRSSGVFLSEHIEGRFLVLDDDASLREMIGTALQMRGAEVVLASRLSDALAEQAPFKLALVDLRLGDERGDAALARLRAAGLVNAALLVTGADLPSFLVEGGEPDGVLRKPFELDDLYERIAEVLGEEASAVRSEIA
jgi:two-component system, cell cycle sensor histidine kinase and response regulator CckA